MDRFITVLTGMKTTKSQLFRCFTGFWDGLPMDDPHYKQSQNFLSSFFVIIIHKSEIWQESGRNLAGNKKPPTFFRVSG